MSHPVSTRPGLAASGVGDRLAARSGVPSGGMTSPSTVLAAFVEGLRAERLDLDIADVRYGFDASMVIRSAFMALPWDQLRDEQGPEFAAHLVQRVALTRYLADVGLALPRV